MTDATAKSRPGDPHLVRAWRFGLTGVVSTGVHVLVATLGIAWLGLSVVIGNATAFAAATAASYCINTRWSFRRPLGAQSLARFVVVALLGLALASGLASVVDGLGYHYLVGIAVIAMAVPAVTFALHTTWTYR